MKAKENLKKGNGTGNSNNGYIKSYTLKKLKAKTNFTAWVIHDDLKFIVKDGLPVLGKFGMLYDHFEEMGFKIKGIELKDRHIEAPMKEFFAGLSLNADSHSRIQTQFMSKVPLSKGKGWMSTRIVADRKIHFPHQLYIIKKKSDISNIQKGIVKAQINFVLIKRLVLEHKATKREIMNLLMEVKKGESVLDQELYTAYIEKRDGQMASIDRFNSSQLDFLWEGNCAEIYNHRCSKALTEKRIVSVICEGQF
jgi:hypothetical protein